MALSMVQMNVDSELLKCVINNFEFDVSMYSTEYDEKLEKMRLAIVTIKPISDLMIKIKNIVLSGADINISIYNKDYQLIEAKKCSMEYINMSKDDAASFSATFLYEKI